MSREKERRKAERHCIAMVLSWVFLICLVIAWNVRAAERKAIDRAAAIEAQQLRVVTYSEVYGAPAPAEDEADKPPFLGDFRVTVYTPHCDGGRWGYKTATGETSEHLATCAVDPDVIELGSVVYVGDLQLTAVDTGSAVKGETIDVFYDGTPEEARAWLTGFGDTAPVWLCQGE